MGKVRKKTRKPTPKTEGTVSQMSLVPKYNKEQSGNELSSSDSDSSSEEDSLEKLTNKIKKKYYADRNERMIDEESNEEEKDDEEKSTDSEEEDELLNKDVGVSKGKEYMEDENQELLTEGDRESGTEDTPEIIDANTKIFQEELSSIPFEEILEVRDKIGLKAYTKAITDARDKTKSNTKKQFKRENKNRPMEISAKKPVPRMKRDEQVAKKKVTRDPRFDDLSGEYSETHFSRNYSFLDDVKSKEKKMLIKKAMKEKDETKKQQILQLINKMDQQEKSAKTKQTRLKRDKDINKQELLKVKEGKNPYFLKNADKKKLDLAEKFKELKKTGKLEQYLSKKRKKNASKDRKALPSRQ